MVLSCSIFIVGKLVFALEGTAYHHAIIESQPFFNGNDELAAFITWVTAPHYKKREVLCDEVIELPSKRIRKSPEQYFPHSDHTSSAILCKRGDQGSSKQSRYSPKRSKQNRRLPNRYKGRKGNPQKKNNQRKQLPLKPSKYSSKRSKGNPCTEKHSKEEKGGPEKNPSVVCKDSPPESSNYYSDEGERCCVTLCENKVVRLPPCREACKSKICIECLLDILEKSDKTRCPICKQAFSPRTFERIIKKGGA
jgi:hypothetical protein